MPADAVFLDTNGWLAALELYTRRSDKDWGLIDCGSFVVMGEKGITQAFTNDRHFEQAGFTNLLPGQGSASV